MQCFNTFIMKRLTPTKNRRYTPEEDATILSCIEASPHNLHMSFITVSKLIDRTPEAVAQHWYECLRKKDPVYMLVSRKHVIRNGKNLMGDTARPTVWQRLLSAIKNF